MAKKTCTQRLADLSLLKINHAENNYQKKIFWSRRVIKTVSEVKELCLNVASVKLFSLHELKKSSKKNNNIQSVCDKMIPQLEAHRYLRKITAQEGPQWVPWQVRNTEGKLNTSCKESLNVEFT